MDDNVGTAVLEKSNDVGFATKVVVSAPRNKYVATAPRPDEFHNVGSEEATTPGDDDTLV